MKSSGSRRPVSFRNSCRFQIGRHLVDLGGQHPDFIAAADVNPNIETAFADLGGCALKDV